MATSKRGYSKTDKLGAVHHFVPQSYLRRFATEGNPDQIVAYEIGKDPYITNIKNVAAQKDLYTYQDIDGSKSAELEDILADLDGQGVESLKLLDAMSCGPIELSKKAKGNLFLYIAFLHTRNVQERKQWAEMYGQSSLVFLQIVASDKDEYHRGAREALGKKYTYQKAESARESLLKGEMKVEFDPMDPYFLGTSLEMSKELYAVLMSKKQPIIVETSTDSRHFVTSDNPVTHYAPENYISPFRGLGYFNAIFQMPLSPTRCLLLINDGMQVETYSCNRGTVDHMNFYTYYYADRWIFSHLNSSTISQMFEAHRAKHPHVRVESPFMKSS